MWSRVKRIHSRLHPLDIVISGMLRVSMARTAGKDTVRLGDVLKAARKFGLQEAGARELFRQWIQEAQSQVEKSERPVARVKLEITCAELYMELDMMTEAAESFRDALYQAQQEGLRDVIQDLERALQTIETVAAPGKYGLQP